MAYLIWKSSRTAYSAYCPSLSRAAAWGKLLSSNRTGKSSQQTGSQRIVDFDSPQGATIGKSNYEVARGWFVFKLFTNDILVDNSLKYFEMSKKYLGPKVTEKALKATVFGQFAGGLDERECRRTVRQLADTGVSSIWNYSIEKDLNDEEDILSEDSLREKEKDFRNVNKKYLKSIKMSAKCNGGHSVKLSAVKFTAIANTHLIKKLNEMLLLSWSVFNDLATNNDIITNRVIPRDRLVKELPVLLSQGAFGESEMNLVQWNKHFSIAGNIERFQILCERANVSPDKVILSDLEMKQLNSFLDKLDAIGKCAQTHGVRVLVDAEQTYFQPLFDHLVLDYLMSQYNREQVVFYNTVQAYLKGSLDNILLSLATAADFKVSCGVKLVRGAYVEQERTLAKQQGYPSPTHPSKKATDKSYNSCLTHLLNQVPRGNVDVVVATHNRESIELALQKIHELGLSQTDGRVVFGQLLGMGDHLTYPLASAGYIANKVVAYGALDDVVPFLSRRAQENRGLMKNADAERLLYTQEMKRRFGGS